MVRIGIFTDDYRFFLPLEREPNYSLLDIARLLAKRLKYDYKTVMMMDSEERNALAKAEEEAALKEKRELDNLENS